MGSKLEASRFFPLALLNSYSHTLLARGVLCVSQSEIVKSLRFNTSKSFSLATFSQQPNRVIVCAYLSKFIFPYFIVNFDDFFFVGKLLFAYYSIYGLLGFRLNSCADDSKG